MQAVNAFMQAVNASCRLPVLGWIAPARQQWSTFCASIRSRKIYLPMKREDTAHAYKDLPSDFRRQTTVYSWTLSDQQNGSDIVFHCSPFCIHSGCTVGAPISLWCDQHEGHYARYIQRWSSCRYRQRGRKNYCSDRSGKKNLFFCYV